MIIFIVILLTVFTLLNLIIYISVKNIFKDECTDLYEINFSIIIAAKNESENITRLISSLESLDYPKGQFEVIIADDNSTDDTYEKANRILNKNSNIKLLKVKDKSVPGKKGALSVAIDNAIFPFILVTDADCTPEPGWLKSYAKKFSEGYDILFGAAPFHLYKGLVNKIASFENLRSSLLSFTTAKLNFAHSAAARNLGFKKEAFNRINGYKNTTETISGDDDLLLREALKHKLKIGIVSCKNSFVFSEAKSKIKDYIKQRARHTQTSFHYFLSHQIILGVWHFLNLFMMISILFSFLNGLFILIFTYKILIDLLLVALIQKNFKYNFNFIEIIFLQFVYEFFLIVIFFYAKFGKIKWK